MIAGVILLRVLARIGTLLCDTSLKNRLCILPLFFGIIPRGSVTEPKGIRLELKRRDHAPVLTDIVEFIALPFPSPSKLEIWSIHVLVMQGR